MANHTYLFDDEFWLYAGSAFSLSGSSPGSAELSDTFDIADATTLENITIQEFSAADEIAFEEAFEVSAEELEPDNCFPFGGTGHTPTIVLQKATKIFGIDPNGNPELAVWYWPDPLVWNTEHFYTLSWEEGEMQPAYEWDFIEDETTPKKRMQSGKIRLFHSMVYPIFKITAENHLCLQQFIHFLSRYALSWIQNTPKDGTEYRRILLYPTGTGWTENRLGETVEPIEVVFQGFLSPERIRGHYGAYKIPITLIGVEHMSHEEWQNFITWSPIDP